MVSADRKIAVYYLDSAYRIHASDCRDCGREEGRRETWPPGTTLLAIAEDEFSDFIGDDPEYYTDTQVLFDFMVNTKVLPCADGLIG